MDILLEQLVPSAEPAVVFASLTRTCVPSFSDRCVVEIDEDERAAYVVDANGVADTLTSDPLPAVAGGRVSTTFQGAAHGVTRFRGVVHFSWADRAIEPLDVALARIVVGRAVAIIAEERLADDARTAHAAADNLRVALASSRQIGNAVGILMVAYKLTDAAAFEMLRELSQRSNRKVLDIARDVVATGAIDEH